VQLPSSSRPASYSRYRSLAKSSILPTPTHLVKYLYTLADTHIYKVSFCLKQRARVGSYT